MIYDDVPPSEPIRQGDIFIGLPRIDISLDRLVFIGEDDSPLETSWDELSKRPTTDVISLIAAARPVAAIVATQDCDAIRSPNITLCEIREFREIEKKAAQVSAPKKWVNLITQHSRLNSKWFYLPPDEMLGFTSKMAVDFLVTLRFARLDLEKLIKLRRGRLNQVADEHFRERISDFFRRYPYDEWYPLNKDELVAYQQDHESVEPFSWQKP
jgi:hypothetical protein